MADKIIITKDITTVPASSLVNGKVLGVNPLNKLSQTTYTEPIPLSQKGAVNGVATLDSNGNVVQKSNLNIEVQPIGLNSPTPSKDGVFMPFEVGIYPNYGNLELTQNEKNSNIVYFYRLNGQFSKVVKSVDISGKANVDGGNITNVGQWKQKLGYVSRSGDTMTGLLSLPEIIIDRSNFNSDAGTEGKTKFGYWKWGVSIGENADKFNIYNLKTFKSVLDILGNGNVGINTTSPQAKLDVNGNAIVANATAPNHAMTFGQFSGELNNVYDQISARANNRLSNLASDLSESEKQAIRQKLGL